jgi:hypothetical protein
MEVLRDSAEVDRLRCALSEATLVLILVDIRCSLKAAKPRVVSRWSQLTRRLGYTVRKLWRNLSFSVPR